MSALPWAASDPTRLLKQPTDEPSKLVTAIRVARATKSIAWQNIVLALGVKGLLLILGALGMANMWEAVFGDVGVMVLAVLNSMRALRA